MDTWKKAALVASSALGLLASFPSHAAFMTASTVPADQVVVDGSPATRSVSFAFSPGTITNVSITVDFMKCSNFNQGSDLTTPLPAACPDQDNDAFANEIVLGLVSPLGTRVILVQGDTIATTATYFPGANGPTPGARITVAFDDSGDPIDSTAFVSSPFGVFFQPSEHLGQFIGESALGTWTLEIEDLAAGDPLGFASFTLDITLTPEPGSVLLMGIGLAGIAARRRRVIAGHNDESGTSGMTLR